MIPRGACYTSPDLEHQHRRQPSVLVFFMRKDRSQPAGSSRGSPATPAPRRETGAVFGRRAFVLIQEGAVDLLDIDAAILDRLERAGSSMILRAAFSGLAKGRSAVSFGGESRLPSHTEWHRVTYPVMPIRDDVHSACCSADGAHQAPTDTRPRLILGRASSLTSTSRSQPPWHRMLQVTWPSASHSAGLPGGYRPDHFV